MREGGTNGRAGAARTRSAPSSTAPPMNQRLTFQVHRVNAKIAQVANSLFRIQQLDLLSSRILVLLLERDEMRVGELVEEMVLPQSTISHQLQRLENASCCVVDGPRTTIALSRCPSRRRALKLLDSATS